MATAAIHDFGDIKGTSRQLAKSRGIKPVAMDSRLQKYKRGEVDAAYVLHKGQHPRGHPVEHATDEYNALSNCNREENLDKIKIGKFDNIFFNGRCL